MTSLTPKDRDRLAQLERVQSELRRAYALVEQFAAAPKEAEQMTGNLRRVFGQLKMKFTAIGFDRLAQMSSQLEVTARRGSSHGPKSRALRDAMGNLNRQVDLERKAVLAQARQEDEKTE
jgi:hypothetical protein